MKRTSFLDRKGKLFLQLLLMYAWVTNLAQTDSFLSVYLLCALAGSFCLCDNEKHPTACSRGTAIWLSVLAAGFATATVLANYPLFEPVTALLNLFNAGISILGGYLIGRSVLLFLLRRLPLDRTRPCSDALPLNPCLVFFGCFAVLSGVFLAYLFTTGYPVYLAHDSLVSMQQIESGIYTNHHPYWYTQFIRLCLNIGYLFSSDINIACAAYSAIQCLIMAACFAYVLVTLYQAGFPAWCLGTAFFLYGFLPYNLTYAITMWKDTLFSGFFLVTVTALYRVIYTVGKSRALNYGAFLLGGLGMCLIRHNGFPLLLLLAVLMWLILGKEHKKLLLMAAAVLLLCRFLNGPALALLGVGDSDVVEVLAAPLQQIARVVALDGTIPQEDLEIMSRIFYLDRVRELYSPEIVDPIKFESMPPDGQAYIAANMGQFLKLWLRLGLRNPGEYLKAWVELTKGFWNGGYYFWIYIRTTWYELTGIGGFEMNNAGKNLFDALFRYTEKPTILEPLYSIGLQVWIIITCFFTCLAQKRKHWIISAPLVALAVGLWFITPVYAEFRYAYPLFLTCPLILLTTVFREASEKRLPQN